MIMSKRPSSLDHNNVLFSNQRKSIGFQSNSLNQNLRSRLNQNFEAQSHKILK
jgi:hypothetical protein